MIDKDLEEILINTMTLPRLGKTGLFRKGEIPSEEIRQELLLHRAVLDKALLDQYDKNKVYRFQSKLWCNLENPDFVDACERAFLDPQLVYSLFEQVKKIFIKNGEDIYHDLDNKILSSLSKEDKMFFLYYEETE